MRPPRDGFFAEGDIVSKGDAITLEYRTGENTSNAVTITAETNGATVAVSSDRSWTTVEELSKAGNPVRILRVKTDSVIGYLETPVVKNRPKANV
jgi:hypothetical protein